MFSPNCGVLVSGRGSPSGSNSEYKQTMKRTCDGCGYEFRDEEKIAAACNYGKGAGPHYWCSKCAPPMEAKDIVEMLEKFMEDSE